MKKLLFIFLCILQTGYAQSVHFTAKELAGKPLYLYSYEGTRVDSLEIHFDALGKATLTLPTQSYRGMIRLVSPDVMSADVILAESNLELRSSASESADQGIDYSKSIENVFLEEIFTTQNLNYQKLAWLEAGNSYFPEHEGLAKFIALELDNAENSQEEILHKVANSPLYAAQYYTLVSYFNQLSDFSTSDLDAFNTLSEQMENVLDIAALYHSGFLWSYIPNQYINMFNLVDSSDKQSAYAHSILKVLERLEGSVYYTDFLSVHLIEMERFGWIESQNIILKHVLTKDPLLNTHNADSQRLIGSYLTKSHGVAPSIVNLQEDTRVYEGGTLVVFYDTQCNSCVNELNRMVQLYPELEALDVRVVSIAADMYLSDFTEYAKKLPWKDNLCDFQGFEGENFVNFGILSTPTFYLISQSNQITGHYFKISDVFTALSEQQ